MGFGGFGLRRSRVVWRTAQALFVVAALLPLVVPWCERAHSTAAIGHWLRSAYGLQCHQRLDRSFSAFGAALPVCARCYGIYCGLGLAAWVGRPRLRTDPLKAWIVIGLVVVLVDVASEWVELRPSNVWFRAATGAFLAYGIALAILSSLKPRRG